MSDRQEMPSGETDMPDNWKKRFLELEKRYKELAGDEERYREIFMVSSDNIFMLDVKEGPRFMISCVNPSLAAMLGRSSGEVSGKYLDETVTADQWENIKGNFMNCMRSGKTLNYEERADFPDGARYFLTSLFPQKNARGEVDRIIGISRNITERKEAEKRVVEWNETLEKKVRERTAELERINSELEAFSYSVSHDLRSPLRSISGFLDILDEDCGTGLSDEARDCLYKVRNSAVYMGSMIDDLLKLSRISRQELTLNICDLTALCRETAAVLDGEGKGRNVTWKIQEGMAVKADSRLMQIAVFNLLSNAYKFTSQTENALISCELSEQDGWMEFSVRDNGAGFDMHYVNKLFGVFQRLHSDRDYQGTGIGLSIVKRIAERHGGRASAEGSLGLGAVFKISLPAVPD